MTEERPKELEALVRWHGTWEATIQVDFSDGEVLRGTMTVEARPVAAGQGIHMDLKGTFGDSGNWEGQALWGYDTESGRVQWFAVSSKGEVHNHTGVWKDEDTLELEWRGIIDGKEAVELAAFRWNSPSEVGAYFTLTVEGELSHTVKGAWTRKGKS